MSIFYNDRSRRTLTTKVTSVRRLIINFICGCGDQELSECIVYGLYVLFNSTLYDRYYRILNGTTQVSSIEVNSMPVPPISIIESMGKELICLNNMSTQACDEILENYI